MNDDRTFAHLLLSPLSLKTPARPTPKHIHPSVHTSTHPSTQVCQAAVEYFVMVNTVPLAERHPQMGAPLFGALAQPLLAHCRYPEGFEGWAECVEEDEETFGR
jgi:hypothetical protein